MSLMEAEIPKSQNQLSPEQALILHRSSHDVVITLHDIVGNDDNPELGPGRLMDKATREELAARLKSDGASGQQRLLPERVLAQSTDMLAWYVPGEIRKMYFNINGRKRSFKVAWPNLLIKTNGTAMAVASYKGRQRPHADTPLYHAPLMNVYDSTQVCIGNTRTPDSVGFEDMPGWEDLVFKTYFSHVNHSKTIKSRSREVDTAEHYAFYEQLAEQDARRFPERKLEPLGVTLSKWIDG